MGEDPPREHLDILLNIPRLRVRESHDDLEELLAFRLGLGNGEWTEPFEISANPIFLFDGEAHANKTFQKIDGVYASHVALIFALPIDATDANAVR